MSINDPQWGNSHRPEDKDPEQAPEKSGAEPVQPEAGQQGLPRPDFSGKPPSPTPPEGPPDLEELWQQMVYTVRCRIARLLGRPLPPAPTPLTEQRPAPISQPGHQAPLAGWAALSFKSWLIGVALIVGAWLVSGFYLVDTAQRGVLSRFGTIVSVEAPGWHWRWPYPVDSVRLINVTADRTLEVALSAQKGRRESQGLMLTADGNLVAVAYAVVYQVTDPVVYLSRAEDPADLLALLAEASLRESVGTQPLAAVQASSDQQTSSAAVGIGQSATERLRVLADPLQLGLAVKALQIREVQLPTPVVQAVKASEREEQARPRALRDTQSASTERLIKARQLAAKLQEESSAYALALDNQRQALGAAGDQPGLEQARKNLADQSTQWRLQYPLLFMGATALQDRVRTPGRPDRGTPNEAPASGSARPTGSDTDGWRNREIMRSRDRVERPGSGS